MEGVVAAEEARVEEDAEPRLADKGGAEEMLRLVRQEAEEDLDRDVFDQVRQRRRWRHGAGGGGCEGLAIWVGFSDWGIAAAQPGAAEE